MTVIAFAMLELHNRGFKPVLSLCKPFYRIFAQFRKECDLHTSLIDAFITFFILSTTKLLNVSISFLLSVSLYESHGDMTAVRLYEDTNIGSVHFPYGVLVLFFFIILPIGLLVFYSTMCCQRCLIRTRLRSHLLQEFMGTFNKYYKDGSDGTIDCCWFAAFYIINRLGFYFMLFFTMTSIFYNLALVYVLICACQALQQKVAT